MRASCPAQLVAPAATTVVAGLCSPACCHPRGCAAAGALGEAIPLHTVRPDPWLVPVAELVAQPRGSAYTLAEVLRRQVPPTSVRALTRETP